MQKLLLLITSLILLAAGALAPSAGAQVPNTPGIDEYRETVPDAGGEVSSGSQGGQATPEAATSDANSTGSPTGAGAGLTEAQAAANGTPAGQLPATGLETLLLALAGAMLVGFGYGLLRFTATAVPGGASAEPRTRGG